MANDVKKEEPQPKIKTYGFELVLMAVVGFLAILLTTIMAYQLFIKARVKNSPEYKTATYYVTHSLSLKNQLLSPIDRLEFDDIHVVREGEFGRSSVDFKLHLKSGVIEDLSIVMVKIADYWLVVDARLQPGAIRQINLSSTYSKVVQFFTYLHYQDTKSARSLLEFIKSEVMDLKFYDFIVAKLHGLEGDSTYATQVLRDIADQTRYSKLAVLYEQAELNFYDRKYEDVHQKLDELFLTYENSLFDEKEKGLLAQIFKNLPSDPFTSIFKQDLIVAQSHLLRSRTYVMQRNYNLARQSVETGIALAKKAKSSKDYSFGLYFKALIYYDMQDWKAAEQAFNEVINDSSNLNLSQKAKCYYYKGHIADKFKRVQDALDYFETAVTLNPFDPNIRKGAIRYLMSRGLVGDLEIALGMALRGIQYNVTPSDFKSLASQIYARLGLGDKAHLID